PGMAGRRLDALFCPSFLSIAGNPCSGTQRGIIPASLSHACADSSCRRRVHWWRDVLVNGEHRPVETPERGNAWSVSAPGSAAAPAGGPTVLRMLLGAQLRRLREAASITRDDAGYHIRASGSKISRLELGRVSFKERDVTDLLELYGVSDQTEREKLVQLTREANATPWYQKFQDVVPDWFHVFVGLEEAAQLIRIYEVQFVPGLLQTEEYARAVVTQGAPGLEPEEVDRRVALRLGRQKLLHRDNPPRLWAIVDEAALRRPMGGRDVLAAQIERLMDAVGEPNITLQVMPFKYGGHAAEGGAFTIMRFPEADLPDM